MIVPSFYHLLVLVKYVNTSLTKCSKNVIVCLLSGYFLATKQTHLLTRQAEFCHGIILGVWYRIILVNMC